MHRLADLLHRLVLVVQPFAEHLGGPGLLLLALLDSSVIALPEVPDALIVVMVLQHPARWFYYGAMTTAGSVAGCAFLYWLGRRGGEAFLQKRFHERTLERFFGVFRRWGLLAVILPSILPPPVPFKPFVLLAGVVGVSPAQFFLAATLGRGLRYIGEAWLAYEFGEQATMYIKNNLPSVLVWLAVAAVAIAGISAVIKRRRPA